MATLNKHTQISYMNSLHSVLHRSYTTQDSSISSHIPLMLPVIYPSRPLNTQQSLPLPPVQPADSRLSGPVIIGVV